MESSEMSKNPRNRGGCERLSRLLKEQVKDMGHYEKYHVCAFYIINFIHLKIVF